VSFWLIGFSSAYLLAFSAGLNTVGIWIGFSLAVITFAMLLVLRFHHLTTGGALPSVALANATSA
jgi:MATE family multidrug resistance protein